MKAASCQPNYVPVVQAQCVGFADNGVPWFSASYVYGGLSCASGTLPAHTALPTSLHGSSIAVSDDYSATITVPLFTGIDVSCQPTAGPQPLNQVVSVAALSLHNEPLSIAGLPSMQLDATVTFPAVDIASASVPACGEQSLWPRIVSDATSTYVASAGAASPTLTTSQTGVRDPSETPFLRTKLVTEVSAIPDSVPHSTRYYTEVRTVMVPVPEASTIVRQSVATVYPLSGSVVSASTASHSVQTAFTSVVPCSPISSTPAGATTTSSRAEPSSARSSSAPLAPSVAARRRGCYRDSARSGSERSLNEQSSVSDDMTVNMCSMHCQGFKYFGVGESSSAFCLRTGRP